MRKCIGKVIHVIAFAGDEKNITDVFETNRADLVHFIVRKKDAGLNRAVKYLRDKNIEIKTTVCSFDEPEKLLGTLSEIISSYQPVHNSVYVNTSGGGTFCAALCALAGMAQKAQVYSVENDTVILLPEVDVILPEKREADVLEMMVLSENSGDFLSASEISELLDSEKSVKSCDNVIDDLTCRSVRPDLNSSSLCSSFVAENSERYFIKATQDFDSYQSRRTIQSRNLMKVSSFMRKMEEKGYVEKKKEGRQMKYRTTEKGRTALYLSGKKSD